MTLGFECLCKMKELFTSIRRTMRCVIVFQITTHQRHNYSRLETRKVGVGMLQWSVLLVGRSWRDWRRWRVEWRGAAGTHWDTGTCCTVCTAPQSTVQCLVLHSDTISSGDNDRDGLQRRTAWRDEHTENVPIPDNQQPMTLRPTYHFNRYSILLCYNWTFEQNKGYWITYVIGDSIFNNDVHNHIFFLQTEFPFLLAACSCFW